MMDDMGCPEKLYDLKEGEIGRGEYFLDESGNMVKARMRSAPCLHMKWDTACIRTR